MLRMLLIGLALAGLPGSAWAKSVTPAKRPKPPTLPKDVRRIDFSKFSRILNGRHPDRGWIYASADGGCHVYLNDGKERPPGSFPASAPVECPPDMLAAEWGYCIGPGTVTSNDKGTECICSPGEGDPPLPAFRMPCPIDSARKKP